MAQSRICCPRISLGFELFFINPDQFFAFAGVFAKNIVSHAIKPGGKLGFATETADVFVSTNKRLLRQIVGQFHIGACELPKQTAHWRLMAAHQLAERVLVAINKNACEQVRITQLHIIV